MADPKKRVEEKSLIERFRTNESPGVIFVRELLWVAAVVAGIALILFLVSGTWPAVVTIESESMVPHMNVGDLVFVVKADRFDDLQTWEAGKETGYKKFGDYGDVLIYAPNGAEGSLIPGIGGGVHPIIHRAIAMTGDASPIPVYYYFYRGQSSPMEYLPVTVQNNEWILSDGTVVARIENGVIIPDTRNVTPSQGYIVPSDLLAQNNGYITKGDNNVRSDQGSMLSRSELGVIQPVQDEWVVGKALFAIPLIGYIPLNIIPVAIILIVLMVLYEYYQKRKGQPVQKGSGKKRLKKK
ncbi:MAG: S26 family signal peptidase [Methanoregulaceae archaeon]|nr:S26 family signal peptidase [Methanoregulaceae archaeon]